MFIKRIFLITACITSVFGQGGSGDPGFCSSRCGKKECTADKNLASTCVTKCTGTIYSGQLDMCRRALKGEFDGAAPAAAAAPAGAPAAAPAAAPASPAPAGGAAVMAYVASGASAPNAAGAATAVTATSANTGFKTASATVKVVNSEKTMSNGSKYYFTVVQDAAGACYYIAANGSATTWLNGKSIAVGSPVTVAAAVSAQGNPSSPYNVSTVTGVSTLNCKTITVGAQSAGAATGALKVAALWVGGGAAPAAAPAAPAASPAPAGSVAMAYMATGASAPNTSGAVTAVSANAASTAYKTASATAKVVNSAKTMSNGATYYFTVFQDTAGVCYYIAENGKQTAWSNGKSITVGKSVYITYALAASGNASGPYNVSTVTGVSALNCKGITVGSQTAGAATNALKAAAVWAQ